jgi:peptide/nickel transport system substrate-binding protein
MKTHASRRGALAMALLLLAACGREKATQAADTGTPESGGVAVVAEGADINPPIIIVANSLLDGDLSADVMNMELLRGVWENGELAFKTAAESPVAIARSFEYFGPDSASIRFHMRSDVQWSDGQPLTAADIVFTYNLLKDPALASPLQSYVARLDSVVAENDSTVSFHFRSRYPEMLSHTAVAPLPKHIYQGVPAADLRTHPTVLDPSGGKLVTSGPWMIGNWRKGQQVTLVPNPHFRPQPRLSQLVIRIIPDPTTRIVELQTGTVDMLKNVSSDKLPTLRADKNIRLEREQKRSYDYVVYNGKVFAPFADPDVRRALTLAIDPDRIIKGLQLEGLAVPAGGPFPPIYKVYDSGLMPPLKPDTAEARRILASKGWTDSDGDGILDKDGKPFRFTLLTNSGNQRRADASLLVQQAWKQIGVDAQLKQLEFNTFINGRLLKHDFEAALGGWTAGLTPDFVADLYGTGQPYNLNEYSNPRVDSLFALARKQPTQAAARPLWQQAAKLVTEDHPYTWLYYYDVVDPVRDRLKGVRIDTYGAYQNTWEWWIPRSQQGRPAPTGPDSAK